MKIDCCNKIRTYKFDMRIYMFLLSLVVWPFIPLFMVYFLFIKKSVKNEDIQNKTGN